MTIPLDQTPSGPVDPKLMEDIQRREELMDKEDQRRRAGRSAAAIKKRIAELEAASAAQEAASEKKTQPRKVTLIGARKTVVIPFPVEEHTGNGPQDEDARKMERDLQGLPPVT